MTTTNATETTPGLLARARQIISTSTQAWGVAPESPRAYARRAQHGHVPLRVLRRLRSAARVMSGSQRVAYAW